jgi:hypothetical protein
MLELPNINCVESVKGPKGKVGSIQEQISNFSREMETIRKNQIELLETKQNSNRDEKYF